LKISFVEKKVAKTCKNKILYTFSGFQLKDLNHLRGFWSCPSVKDHPSWIALAVCTMGRPHDVIDGPQTTSDQGQTKATFSGTTALVKTLFHLLKSLNFKFPYLISDWCDCFNYKHNFRGCSLLGLLWTCWSKLPCIRYRKEFYFGKFVIFRVA